METPFNVLEVTAQDLQTKVGRGELSYVQIIDAYIQQIERFNPRLRAVIQIVPRAGLVKRAEELQRERQDSHSRGPLHGIPILVKDNIDTHPDTALGTTGGSFALLHSRPRANADVVENLIRNGAIILGKANLSEFAYFKGALQCGWSAVGGQTQNPYVSGGVDLNGTNDFAKLVKNPGGSSSGSAVAVAAGFSPITIGTDTCGSLTMPANRAGIFAMKPTIGLLSQKAMMDAERTTDMHEKLIEAAKANDWSALRIGMVEPKSWTISSSFAADPDGSFLAQRDEDIAAACKTIREHGAKVVYPIDLIRPKDMNLERGDVIDDLVTGNFDAQLNRYLSELEHSPVRSLKEIIDFNNRYPLLELPPGYENQDWLIGSNGEQKWSSEETERTIRACRAFARQNGIDAVLAKYEIDVILCPADSGVDSLIAASGQPLTMSVRIDN
ncbi:amidase signature domain-containing protein [Aspergillus multicolor]|uniref:amidase signature domain-containing protein n=1 Tax=Aspergillus multicolor TaxID=41759 RepID=UPI003CCCA40C